jgi:hypothetical protein
MNNLTFVVEASSDVILMRGLLRAETGVSFRFFAGQGRMSLASLGRNILVHDGGPLMVVTDAETLNPSRAKTDSRMVEAALRSVAPNQQFSAFAFVPEIEVIFFEAPDVLARKFGSEVVSPAVIDRGHYASKDTLRRILQGAGISQESYFKELTDDDLAELRQGDQAAKLLAVVEGLAVEVGR